MNDIYNICAVNHHTTDHKVLVHRDQCSNAKIDIIGRIACNLQCRVVWYSQEEYDVAFGR